MCKGEYFLQSEASILPFCTFCPNGTDWWAELFHNFTAPFAGLYICIIRTAAAIILQSRLPSNSTEEEKWKKAPREMQTLHAGCSKMDPKVFAPPQTPFPAVRDGQNLISWRWSLSLPTNPVWWRSMHAISIYRGNRPTHKHRPPARPPQTGLITIHCAAKLSVQCNNTKSNNSIHITESHKTTESYVDITSKTYISFHILPKNNIWC